ncbi:CU044_5270 family protein [Streptomyces sp. NBC_00299]|uniref:CU044_5270 family protein n=1 Tax=Streptomyces sp. NBC_00299 TaxID=2975705 RepID=UPI002E2DC8AB|nr:CU044_5270 family protein [Streptomyces sp. NBC_00299]
MNTDPRRRDQPADHRDLAEMLPAPGRPALAQDRHRVLRESLMEHITEQAAHEQTSATDTSPAASAHRSLRRRLTLVAAPLALAVAVGLGVTAVDSADDDKSGTPAAGTTAGFHGSATQLLDQIALAAANRPAATVGDDQYIYTKSQGSAAELGVEFNDPAELAKRKGTSRSEQYKGAVRSEQWDSVDGKRSGLRKGVAVADPSKEMTMAMYGTGYLTFRQLQALPTDPDALLNKLYGDTRMPPNRRLEITLANIRGIIDNATLLPDLSAALYRAVAKLPGARVVDHVRDAAGREGVGLTFEGAPGSTWVFDSSSLVYLGTTKIALLDIGVADKKGEPPAGSS